MIEEKEVEYLAYRFMISPEEVKIGFWEYIFEGIEAVEQGALTFKQFNQMFCEMSTLNMLAIQQAEEMIAKTTIQ